MLALFTQGSSPEVVHSREYVFSSFFKGFNVIFAGLLWGNRNDQNNAPPIRRECSGKSSELRPDCAIISLNARIAWPYSYTLTPLTCTYSSHNQPKPAVPSQCPAAERRMLRWATGSYRPNKGIPGTNYCDNDSGRSWSFEGCPYSVGRQNQGSSKLSRNRNQCLDDQPAALS